MSELANQFFKAFIKNNRWQLYVKGLGNTLEELPAVVLNKGFKKLIG